MTLWSIWVAKSSTAKAVNSSKLEKNEDRYAVCCRSKICRPSITLVLQGYMGQLKFSVSIRWWVLRAPLVP